MYAFQRRNPRRDRDGFLRKKRPSFLAPILRYRVQILDPTQTEESEGGFDQTYTTLKTIWAGVRPISHNAYVRYSSVEDFGNVSHEFIIRKNAVGHLNTAFTIGFSSGFNNIPDLHPLKGTYYLMLEQGSTAKGRLFRIKRTMDDSERRENYSVLCEEIEERGTGFQG